MFLLGLYNFLIFLAVIFLKILCLFKPKLNSFVRRRHKKFIVKKNISTKKSILIHFSSVGEFNVAKPLIEKLINKGENVVLSVMTDTGMEEIKKSEYYEKVNGVVFFPLDSFSRLKKIYKLYNINKTIIIETEIWVNLFYIASSKNRKLFIVNGRLSDKNMKSYMKYRFIFKYLLKKVNKIMVQSEEDKDKYIQLLSDDKNENLYENIIVHKNLKYYISYEYLNDENKSLYYENLVNRNKKIIVCGSTRHNEEKVWIKVFEKLKERIDEFQLIIVPRHLDRINEILSEFYKNKKFDISIGLFSDVENFQTERYPNILLVDKMGVLRDFYQLADYVFVGGTLTNVGGHSILEPMYYGHKPIIGEYFNNIKDIVNDARKTDYVHVVKGINELNDVNEEIEKISDEIVNYILKIDKREEKIIVTDFFPNKKEINNIVSIILDDC